MAALQGLAGLSSAERYDSIQLKTFTRWWNMYLKERQLKLEDLCEDIRSGVPGIVLLEALTSTTGTKYNKKPKSQFQKLENHSTFLNVLKAQGVKLVNIGAEDLHDGKKKLVLGLTWTLILKYEISKFGIDENMILKWVRLRVGDIEVTVGRIVPRRPGLLRADPAPRAGRGRHGRAQPKRPDGNLAGAALLARFARRPGRSRHHPSPRG